jgi:hypothetical protein
MPRFRWFALAAICVALVAGFIPIYSMVLRIRAKHLIHSVSSLCEQPDDAPTLGTAQALFHGNLRQMEICNSVRCGYEAVASNGVLTALHWTPYSELRSEVWVHNGKIETVVLDFASSANPRHGIVAHLYIQGFQDGPGRLFDLDPWEKSSASDTNGIVTVSPESFRANKQSVIGFDLNCLTNHDGCPTVAGLFPTVWAQENDRSIRCRLQNSEGFIEGPAWLRNAL